MKWSKPVWFKKQIFPCFCVRQNSTSLSPICYNFAEFEVVPNKVASITQATFKVWFILMFFSCLLNEDWDHLELWHRFNYFTEVRFQISFYVIIKTCLLVWNCLCRVDFTTAVSQLSIVNEKTCCVDRKCLSFSLCFSLPARCKFIVLIFKINFLWFWPAKPENRFPCFFVK